METSNVRYRHRRRLWVAVLVLLGFSSLVAAPAFADPILSISPSPAIVSLGSSFSLDVEIADATDLFGYQLDLRFDPSILQASGVTDGPFFTSGGGISLLGGVFTAVLDNSLGAITILDVLEVPVPPAMGATGSGVLAMLNFIAIGTGNAAINFDWIVDDSTGVASAQTQDGSVHVASVSDSPIPVPVTLILLVCLMFGHQRHRIGVSKARPFES